jgi:hypothetical protein
MIVSCDPPRHALLIHFGSRERTPSIHTVTPDPYSGASVELALNRHPLRPTLAAIHFVRHGFRLPFVDPESSDVLASDLCLQSGRLASGSYFFHFVHEPRDVVEWEAYRGLTVLITQPQSASSVSGPLADRPILQGIVVHDKKLGVDIDASEFRIEFGSDNLKDVSAELFFR